MGFRIQLKLQIPMEQIPSQNPQKHHLIDARSHCEYIGWRSEKFEERGHLPNSINIPSENQHEDIKNFISEQLKIGDKLTIYDSGSGEALKLSEILKEQGFSKENIQLKNLEVITQNDKQTKKSLISCQNSHLLVPPSYVHQKSQEQDSQTVIIEVGYRNNEPYLEQHIPSSIYIDSTEYEVPPYWMLRTDEQLCEIMGEIGINIDSQVIVLNRGNVRKCKKLKKNQWEIMASARLAVLLLYLGVKDVRVLNGGLQAYESAGYSLERGYGKLSPKNFGTFVPLRPHLYCDRNEVKDILKSEKTHLIDIRTIKQWEGAESGYGYFKEKGRIQGAIFHGFSESKSASDIMGYTSYGKMKTFEEILPIWMNSGISLEKRLVFYCGNGWRASEILFYSLIHGLTNVSIYSNGWMEWSRYSSDC